MWFTIRAVPFSPESLKILLAAFLGLIFLFLVLRFAGIKVAPLLRKRLFKLSNLFLTAGIIYLIFLFLNYERVAIFGSRICFLILGIVFLVWLGFILYDMSIRMPREKKRTGEKEKFEKYLPK